MIPADSESLPEESQASGTREALRAAMLHDAQDQVARWRRVARQQEEQIASLKGQLQNQKGVSSAPSSPNRTAAGSSQVLSDKMKQASSPNRTVGPSAQAWLEKIKQRSAPSSPNRTAGASGWREMVKQASAPSSPQVAGASGSRDAAKHYRAIGSTSNGSATNDAGSPPSKFSPQYTPPCSASRRGQGVAVIGRMEESDKDSEGEPSVGSSVGSLCRAAIAAESASAPAPTNRRIDFTSSRNSLPSAGASSQAVSAHAAVPTPSRAWGPGSAPRRCPGLGTPTRKKQQHSESASQPGTNSSAHQPLKAKPVEHALDSGRVSFEPRRRASLSGGFAGSVAATPTSKDACAAGGNHRNSISLGLPSRKSVASARETHSQDSPAVPMGLGARTPPRPYHSARASASGASPLPNSEKGSVYGSGESASRQEGPEEEVRIPKHITGIATLWDKRK